MSDSLITRKEHSHNTPLHYGYRKDFNDLLNSFFNGWLELPAESAAFKNMEPKIEVAENENDVTVCAELPGISEKDVDLEISSDGYLTLSGEKRQEKKEHSKGSYFSEISYGSFKGRHHFAEMIKYGHVSRSVSTFYYKRILHIVIHFF